MSLRTLVIVGALMELIYASFYFVHESPTEVLLFIAVQTAAFVLYAAVFFRLRAQPTAEASLLKWIIGFAVLFRVTLLFHQPVGSDDIYRYVWDGKVAAHGINPFAFAPADSTLRHLHTEELPSKINFPSMRTIYPPLAQVLFFFSNKLFGDSISGLKFLLVLADLATILVLILLTRSQQTQLTSVLLYAWSPLPILYFGLDGHVDALGIPFLLLAMLFVLRKKMVSGAVSLGLAALAKLYPLFVAPLLFPEGRGWKRVLLPLIPALMLLIGSLLYWEPTGGLIESFIVFNSTFEFNGSIFSLVYEIVGSNRQAHVASTLLFLVWLLGVFFLKRSFIEKVFLAFMGFVLLAPVVQPWYLTWLAALITLRWSVAVFVLLGLSNLSNFVVYEYRLAGVWEDNRAMLLLEYVPFYVLLAFEMARGRFGRQTHAMELGQ